LAPLDHARCSLSGFLSDPSCGDLFPFGLAGCPFRYHVLSTRHRYVLIDTLALFWDISSNPRRADMVSLLWPTAPYLCTSAGTLSTYSYPRAWLSRTVLHTHTSRMAFFHRPPLPFLFVILNMLNSLPTPPTLCDARFPRSALFLTKAVLPWIFPDPFAPHRSLPHTLTLQLLTRGTHTSLSPCRTRLPTSPSSLSAAPPAAPQSRAPALHVPCQHNGELNAVVPCNPSCRSWPQVTLPQCALKRVDGAVGPRP